MLCFLDGAGVFSAGQRELVIERALALNETPVSIEAMKVIVLMVLWSQEAEVDALILEELLDDGSPRTIH
jgi:Smg protein